jgi:hypothetical protein
VDFSGITNVSDEQINERGGERAYVSARTIRVRLAFSMVNFVLPSWPAMRPYGCMLMADCSFGG